MVYTRRPVCADVMGPIVWITYLGETGCSPTRDTDTRLQSQIFGKLDQREIARKVASRTGSPEGLSELPVTLIKSWSLAGHGPVWPQWLNSCE